MTTLAGLEYTYINAPRAMQGVSVGLFYMVLGITHSASTSLSYMSGLMNSLESVLCILREFLLIYIIVFILIARKVRWD